MSLNIRSKHSITSKFIMLCMAIFALQTLKKTIMASSEDFKRILELYNQESKSSGVSIVSFCQKNGIVYSQFERWYKNRHNVKVHAVDIVDKDGAYKVQNTCTSPCVIDKKILGSEYATESESTLFTLQIKSTTGMYFQQKNIDYKSLKDLVEKMEVLCLR